MTDSTRTSPERKPADATAKAPSAAGTKPREESALREWTKSILFAIVAWLILKTFLLEAFRIPSASMENTLLIGDFLFVNKAIYGAAVPFTDQHLPAFREPRRNEILVFNSVEEDLDVVKRAVGVPGDTLAMRGGTLYLNGSPVDEPYVVHSDLAKSEPPEIRARMRAWQQRYYVGENPETYAPDLQDWGPILVPPNSYFMMGDNREESHDSRTWGFLPRQNVQGTPMFIYYSFNGESWRSLPWLTDIRWNRFFTRPR
ncbi:MAG TPA: signal peptidase I [Gemmatimonadales bacterium]|nr:signal peptidase I [Gemmatimonadales bacterium]